MPVPGPHSSILQTGGRSLDTAYRILHATWLKFSKDAGHIGYRMQTTVVYRMEVIIFEEPSLARSPFTL